MSVALVENPDLEAYGMELLALYPQLDAFFIGNEQGDFIFTKRFADGSIGTQEIDRSLATPLRTWTYRDTAGNVTEVEITDDFTYDPRERPWYDRRQNDRSGLLDRHLHLFYRSDAGHNGRLPGL
jgi:adenylate cyclase